MAKDADSSGFYDALPRSGAFDDLTRAESYRSLPEDWMVGASDIVGSTRAIEAGRYKTVNMVGAAVISAQINASGGRAFPFVFGGDGAVFACPPANAARAADALAAVRAWAEAEFALQLRVAMVPVTAIRAAGLAVQVARYQPAPGVDYAMFGGGGVSWAEARMKEGAFDLPQAPAGTVPDLTGLSCRWSHMRARNGTILSLVVQPVAEVPGEDFARLAESILRIAGRLERAGHPVPPDGPGIGWPPPGATLEAQASHGAAPLARRRAQVLLETLIAWMVLKVGVRIGGFDPRRYRSTVGRNADFRKFDDGLKMTLDCDPATLADLRAVLEAAEAAGIARHGMHQQDEAMMTCIVPSIQRDDHVHFIDGAAGGYTRAAARIKAAG